MDIATFWTRVDRSDLDGCWPWTGARHPKGGYGLLRLDGKPARAHRVAYEDTVGPVPEGLTLDHVRPRCVLGAPCCNPAHMEPVTRSENSKRTKGYRPVVAECAKGHPFTDENTAVAKRGERVCRTCRADAARAWRDRGNDSNRARQERQRRDRRS